MRHLLTATLCCLLLLLGHLFASRAMAAALIVITVSGCSSVNQAGTASYTIRPMLLDGHAVCCEVAVHNGKEYASLDALIERRGDDYTVHLVETGVEAFKGQQIAAGALKSGVSLAGKAAAGAAIASALPLVGPALAAPGIGAAAVGAGALAVGQQVAK